MKEIELTLGAVAFVDDVDFVELSRYKWSLTSKGWGYAVRKVRGDDGINHNELMHRKIISANPGDEVDHIDGNLLNNQRNNLRICTHSQNMANHQLDTISKSGFWGVSKNCSGWQARIWVNGHQINLGTYIVPEEAARVRDKAAIKYFGEFATLNFPMKEEHD